MNGDITMTVLELTVR